MSSLGKMSLDKMAILFTIAIVAIALGVASSGGAAQDAGPAVSTPTMSEKVMKEPAQKAVKQEDDMMKKPAGPVTHTVLMPVGTAVPGCEKGNLCYTPAKLPVNKGDTVEWINEDTAAHTVTSGSPAIGPSGVFDSSLVMADATYAFTFEKSGSYGYFCMVHPWMTGSVTVN
jgi:plastocyanin